MIKLNKVYTHRKGIDVFTERFCEIKINGVWVSGIAYSEGMSFYVRTLEDFESSFKPKN